MNEETIKKYYGDPKFARVTGFVDKFDHGAFQLLVDLSVNYLSIPLINILNNFGEYLRNYNDFVN